jgi:hypothetical protein
VKLKATDIAGSRSFVEAIKTKSIRDGDLY